MAAPTISILVAPDANAAMKKARREHSRRAFLLFVRAAAVSLGKQPQAWIRLAMIG